MLGIILFYVVVFGCSFLFTYIGFTSIRSKKPVQFFSHETVDFNVIKDVNAYNKENGIMWLIYSLPYWVSGILFYNYPFISSLIAGVWSLFGVIFLVVKYKSIYNRFKR